MIDFNNLFYTCSLIEYIGRLQKIPRSEVVKNLGLPAIQHIYNYSDVLHCDDINCVADVFIGKYNIPSGDFDNVSKCKYNVPTFWDIGKVYARFAEDLVEEDASKAIYIAFTSWVSDNISNYNSDFYYQFRDYIYECYKAGYVLP